MFVYTINLIEKGMWKKLQTNEYVFFYMVEE